MFNPERKQRYAEFSQDSKCIPLFKRTERFEAEQNRDVCEMNTEELLDILKSFSRTTAVSERSRLIKYIEWCRANGFCRVNWLDKRNCPKKRFEEAISENESKYYLSPEKYREYVRIIQNSPKSYDPDFDISFFMAMYEGIQNYHDLVYLTTDDLDYEGGTLMLHSCGRIKVTQELLRALEATAGVVRLKNKSRESVLSHSFRENSVWRSVSELDEYGETQKYRYRLLRLKDILEDKKLTISNISSSGIFHYMVERTGEDGLDILSDMKDSGLSAAKLDMRYQKYFAEKQLDITFRGFAYRFKDYLEAMHR